MQGTGAWVIVAPGYRRADGWTGTLINGARFSALRVSPGNLSLQDDYARYCGSEFEANRDGASMRDSMREYFDDCAQAWGFEDWRSLPKDKQLLVRRAFEEGRAAERSAREDLARMRRGVYKGAARVDQR